jgi:hypothetical protein
MSNKQINMFTLLLLSGVVALFFPATAFEKSNAMAQEYYYPEYEENTMAKEYYPQSDEYVTGQENSYYYPEYAENGYYDQNYYDPYEENKNKDPILNIKKELLVCNKAVNNTDDFFCTSQFGNPSGPESGEYVPCTAELCPNIDESVFAAQIFKDVATVRDLTPEGTPVNLNKFHYSVAEGAIDKTIFDPSFCAPTGFDHSTFYTNETQDSWVFFNICVQYEGDCEGVIYPGQVKTCTIENYIWSGSIVESINGNDAVTNPTTTTTASSSNAISSQSFSLGEGISSNLAN